MALHEGQLVHDRYTVIKRIGSGGMADVWLASDGELGREVALKVLHENWTRDRQFVERFRREALAAAGLQHENVVSIFDRGQVDDTHYIAMEYVEGDSLRELMDRGVTIEEASRIVRQVLGAAEFAHSRGIVHRDLKPMNVLIDPEGRVKVTDFGIARAGDSDITQTGSVMGTAQYLSPEQAQGTEVTAASDVYSVGVILFEMLTGRVPFEGDNAVAIAMKQVTEQPPPPSSLNPLVPPALDSVVLRALAKDPAHRYASAAEMHRALDEAEAHPELASHTERHQAYVPPAPRSERRRWIWAAAIAALVLAAAAAAFLLTRPDEVTVPRVTGLDQAAAAQRLQRAGFEVVRQPVEHAESQGTVVEQNPRAGSRVDEGSTVTIIVSLGPAPAPVPDVSGLGRKRARAKLENAGFEVNFDTRPSTRVARGRAIETEPAAGTQLATGETITVVISVGAETVSVPSVVGQGRIAAKAALEDLGLLVSQVPRNADEPEDQVIEQLPPAGSVLDEGERVTIVYSTGAGTVVLADVVGQRQSFAERRLSAAGLSVSIRQLDTEDRSEDEIVLSQAPSPGTRLRRGDRVTLTVGRFVAPEPPPPPPGPDGEDGA